ncbi:MAG TPA: FixH family protein [Capsulimonadaceae bacterium]|nr:FixH family protein [Capsulimonadaceae bacterium]
MIRRSGLLASLLALVALCSCRAPSKPAAPSPIDLTASWKASLGYPAAIKALTNVPFTLTITDSKTGKPVDASNTVLDLDMPTMSMPPNTVLLKPIRPGVYAGKGIFTMAGSWRVVATATNLPGDEWRESFGPVTVK